MDEDALNMSIRRFLKKVGITSQREIEATIRQAVSDGKIEGKDFFPVSVKLEIPELGLNQTIEGKIELD